MLPLMTGIWGAVLGGKQLSFILYTSYYIYYVQISGLAFVCFGILKPREGIRVRVGWEEEGLGYRT